MSENAPPAPNELQIEADFIKRRRLENQTVSRIADQNGLLGENSNPVNASEFFTKSRVLDPSLIQVIFNKAGLIIANQSTLSKD